MDAMTATEETVRWLSRDEQHNWRGWLAAHTLLREALDREMKADHGISLADYEILVRLSEAPGRRMRMSELAEMTLSSRSRLSHQVARMEEEGFGACSNTGACSVECPKEISMEHIARLNWEFIKARITSGS